MVHQSKFSAMDVPSKDMAIANFMELGGVPRYVLRACKMGQGKHLLDQAVATLMFDRGVSNMTLHPLMCSIIFNSASNSTVCEKLRGCM